MAVYNITGQLVATLVEGVKAAGTHKIVFNAQELPTGAYIYRLEADGQAMARKLMLIK